MVLAGVAAVLVNLANVDLDRGVVLGLNDAVGRRALAGDVTVEWRGMLDMMSFFCVLSDAAGASISMRVVFAKVSIANLLATLNPPSFFFISFSLTKSAFPYSSLTKSDASTSRDLHNPGCLEWAKHVQIDDFSLLVLHFGGL